MKRKTMVGSRRPQRRAEIVSAAHRVIEQKGIEGASIRAIARELGCTTGVLMHHFVSKEELLRTTLDEVFRPFDERLANAKSQVNRLEGMRQMLLYFLPIDEPKRATVRSWLWIVLHAAVDQSLAFDYRQRSIAFRTNFNELLAEGQKTGVFRADFDPAVETDFLLALVDRQLERLINPKAGPRHRTRKDSHPAGLVSQ